MSQAKLNLSEIIKMDRSTTRIFYIDISDIEWNNTNVKFDYSYTIFIGKKYINCESSGVFLSNNIITLY